MKLSIIFCFAIAIVNLAACHKMDPDEQRKLEEKLASALASAASSASVTAGSAPAAKAAFVQKGIAPGKVAVGYMELLSDPAQCAVVTDTAANKAKFEKDADKLAKMMKGKIVASCPTENVVGTCNAGFGMLGNYYGPKWTAETAKKDCLSSPHQKWVD